MHVSQRLTGAAPDRFCSSCCARAQKHFVETDVCRVYLSLSADAEGAAAGDVIELDGVDISATSHTCSLSFLNCTTDA